jgi:hypothetical protein
MAPKTGVEMTAMLLGMKLAMKHTVVEQNTVWEGFKFQDF